MRGSPIVYDGLWRCLCPGINGRALRLAVNSSRPWSRVSPPSTRPTSIACLRAPNGRSNSSYPSLNFAPLDKSTTRPLKNGVPPTEALLMPSPPTNDTLHRASVDDIKTALMIMRQPGGWSFHGQEVDRHSRIILFVRHLLSERGQVPSPFIYECMMDAMVDPQGSVKGIRKLLDDMRSQKIQPTSELCQSALAALANHPDYVLRQEILDTMHEFWFVINTGAKQSVLLGLLRDEQYELAYLRLTEMIDNNARIDLWVYDIFIMVFGKLGFIDEMLLLLYSRRSLHDEDKVMPSLLYYVLDVSSQAFHYPGTIFGWNNVVRTTLFQPSDGIVENVLATAARHGDASLATEALDKLAQRTRLMAYHYEAVVEAFAAHGDMAGAFRTLCVMKKNGILIGRGNTRAVYEALRQHPSLIREAEQSIRNMASSEQFVPVAAVGVVMEALAESGRAEAATSLYRDAQALCGEPASPSMIQMLITTSNDAETTHSLLGDYKTLVHESDDPTQPGHVYNGLITACAEAGELDLAFRFANRALKGTTGSLKDAGWIRVLLAKAVEVEDARIWGVVDELGRDEEMGRELGRMLRQMRITRRAGLVR